MKKTILIIVSLIILIGIVFFVRTQAGDDNALNLPSGELAQLAENQDALSPDEIDMIISRLQDIILLPEEESPVVAQIRDSSTLRQQQAFYQDVNDGDFLILYAATRKAILYSVQQDKIINVGPIQTQEQTTLSPASTQPAAEVSNVEQPQEIEIISEEENQ